MTGSFKMTLCDADINIALSEYFNKRFSAANQVKVTKFENRQVNYITEWTITMEPLKKPSPIEESEVERIIHNA